MAFLYRNIVWFIWQVEFTVIFLGTKSLASTIVQKQRGEQDHLWTTVPRNVIRNPDVGVW